MSIELLYYSLERIASLQNFYESEYEGIIEKANQGKKRNMFGPVVHQYFSMVVSNDSDNAEEISEFKKRLDSFVEIVHRPDETTIGYRIKNAEYWRAKGYELNLKKAANKYYQYSDMPIIHGSNTLIMLITRFEEFISNFLAELYMLFPQRYLDDQTICFSEVVNSSIEEITSKILAHRVDAIMRESYTEWFKIFENHKIPLDSYQEEMTILKEMYARRNILVHNSGQVNNSYLSSVEGSSNAIGDVLTVDQGYLANAFSAVNTLIFAIIVGAAKLTKEERNKYLEDVFDSAFEQLCDGKFLLCSKIFKSLLLNKYIDEEHRLMSQVNYWISEIELVGLETVQDEINRFDVSALNPKFSLAKDVLLENYDDVKRKLDDLYSRELIHAEELEIWPLFKKFRTTSQYFKFKTEHADDFRVTTYERGTDNSHEEICEIEIAQDMANEEDTNESNDETLNEVNSVSDPDSVLTSA